MKRISSIILVVVTFITLTSFKINKENLRDIIEVLKHVETNNDPTKIGDNGKALGVLQIHKACILDVNRYYGTEYTHEDAINILISEDIFIKYISIGIRLYEKKCGYLPTEKEIVRMWNGGIYSGYKYEDTLPYLKKYIKYKNELNVID